MLEFLEFTFGRAIGKLFLFGILAIPALALLGCFGALPKKSRKKDTDAEK